MLKKYLFVFLLAFCFSYSVHAEDNFDFCYAGMSAEEVQMNLMFSGWYQSDYYYSYIDSSTGTQQCFDSYNWTTGSCDSVTNSDYETLENLSPGEWGIVYSSGGGWGGSG